MIIRALVAFKHLLPPRDVQISRWIVDTGLPAAPSMVLTSLFRSGMSKLASFAGGTTEAIADMKPETAPLVTFGVCTDLQWAEVDDRIVHGTTTRSVSAPCDGWRQCLHRQAGMCIL